MDENKEKAQEPLEQDEEIRKLLSPCIIDEDDDSHIAVEDLRFALSHKKVHNIAVTGNYGSGKSSVVDTCLNEMGIENQVLRISMSTYNESGTEHIEQKIVQHIHYKSDRDKIPYSTFSMIHDLQLSVIKKWVIYTIIAFICFFIVFEPSSMQVDSFYKAYHKICGFIGPNVWKYVDLIGDAGALAYLTWFVYRFGIQIVTKLNRFRNIKVEAMGVKVEATKDTSYFNVHLDEIVYVISSNDYKYVLFEDLDRIKNASDLFLKIRELNMLLNESEAFKKNNRTVTFIYAIKDDVFTRELRTKCFDYIVAVMPVVDHYNVNDYLIDQYKKKGLLSRINDADLKKLTSNISGLRELKNIMNEYSLYERSYKRHVEDELDERKLLAIIVYKNLYPQDFAKVYSKNGFLYHVATNKKTFCDVLTGIYKELIDTTKMQADTAKKQIAGIRKQYLDVLAVDNVTMLIKKGVSYSLAQVAESDKLFDWFANDEFDSYQFQDGNRESHGKKLYNYKFEDIEKKVTEDMDYYEATDSAYQDLDSALERQHEAERAIKVIESSSYMEVVRDVPGNDVEKIIGDMYLQEYPPEKTKEETEKSDHMDKEGMVSLIHTFIYNGYIEEDYYQYLSKFYPGILTESDHQIKNALMLGIAKGYDARLYNADAVVSDLDIDDFNNPSILNYDILNCLLKGGDDKEHFLKAFVDTARRDPQFIVDYFNKTAIQKAKDTFRELVFDGWANCVSVIKDQETDLVREGLLKLLLVKVPYGLKLNEEEKRFIESRYDFICENIESIEYANLKVFIVQNTLKFASLSTPTDKTRVFYTYCIENSYYQISKHNLEVILGEDYIHKSITTILEDGREKVKNNLIGNLQVVIKILPDTSTKEDKKAIVYLIDNKSVDKEWLNGYILKQEYFFEETEGLTDDGLRQILQCGKLVPSWQNLLSAFEIRKDIDQQLVDFVTENVDSFKRTNYEGENASALHTALFRGEKLPMPVFCDLISRLNYNFNLNDVKTLSEERIAVVIKEDLIDVNPEILEQLMNNCSKELACQYFINHYDELLDDENVDITPWVDNSMCIFVLNSTLTITQKRRFLDNFAKLNKTAPDAVVLAEKICHYYNDSNIDTAVNLRLLLAAFETYNDTAGWKVKIDLINKLNPIFTYNRDWENSLLNTLGGEYKRLTYPYGHARFEMNDENRQLLDYLKGKGHYISNVIEKDGQYYVTFKNS